MNLARCNRTISANLILVIREYPKGLESLGEGQRGLRAKAAIVLVGSTAGKYGEAGHADSSNGLVIPYDCATWS